MTVFIIGFLTGAAAMFTTIVLWSCCAINDLKRPEGKKDD